MVMFVDTPTAGEGWVMYADNPYEQSSQFWSQGSSDVPMPSSQDWLTKMRTEVYKHSEVEGLYVSISDDEMVVDYWIVIPHRDIELVRTLVRDQRKSIVSLFANTENAPFQLDFHIIYLEGQEAEDLVPSDAITIPNF